MHYRLTRLYLTGLLLRPQISGNAGKLLGTDDTDMPTGNCVLILDGNLSVVSWCTIARNNPHLLHARTAGLTPRCRFHVPDVDNSVPGAEPKNRKRPDAGIIQYLLTGKHCRDSNCVPSGDKV